MKCSTPDGIIIFNNVLLDVKYAYGNSYYYGVVDNVVKYCFHSGEGIVILYNGHYYRIPFEFVKFLNKERLAKLKDII